MRDLGCPEFIGKSIKSPPYGKWKRFRSFIRQFFSSLFLSHSSSARKNSLNSGRSAITKENEISLQKCCVGGRKKKGRIAKKAMKIEAEASIEGILLC
jgi:hypothetical protein